MTSYDSLSISQSITGARWALSDFDDSAVMRVMQQHQIPDLLARLVVARAIPLVDVERFLTPRLARDFPDPFAMMEMGAAAQDVADAVMAGHKIGVFADFDVDGATSSAVLSHFFRMIGTETDIHIPDRMNEGYGPNAPALLGLQARGCALAILCDCGITAHTVLAQTHDAGFPVIVLDHHEPDGQLPPAAHVINPKRPDDQSGYRMLAAVGVTFLFTVAVNKILRERGYYESKGMPEPPLKDLLDLVALGTLCDMVPLTGPNRVLVRTGMQALNARKNIGIAALARVAKINPDEPITSTHIGFGLGPRINAGSRVDQADLGSRLLSCTDEAQALRLAEILDDCNMRRREMEQSTVQHAVRLVTDQGLDQHPVIVVGHEDWHPGVAGLVASRIKDRFNRPTCVMTYAQKEDGSVEIRGSGRSVKGFDMAALFQGAYAAGHVIKGGGHAMAGGFSMRPDQVDAFRAYVLERGAGMAAGMELIPVHQVDSVAFVRSLHIDAARVIEDHLGPYGPGHPEPLFVLPNVRIAKLDILSGSHIRAMITDAEGGPWVKAMAFRAAETELGAQLRSYAGGGPLHLLGTLRLDRWQGRETPVFYIQDAAHSVQGNTSLAA